MYGHLSGLSVSQIPILRLRKYDAKGCLYLRIDQNGVMVPLSPHLSQLSA
jgi:hypothetical protein